MTRTSQPGRSCFRVRFLRRLGQVPVHTHTHTRATGRTQREKREQRRGSSVPEMWRLSASRVGASVSARCVGGSGRWSELAGCGWDSHRAATPHRQHDQHTIGSAARNYVTQVASSVSPAPAVTVVVGGQRASTARSTATATATAKTTRRDGRTANDARHSLAPAKQKALQAAFHTLDRESWHARKMHADQTNRDVLRDEGRRRTDSVAEVRGAPHHRSTTRDNRVHNTRHVHNRDHFWCDRLTFSCRSLLALCLCVSSRPATTHPTAGAAHHPARDQPRPGQGYILTHAGSVQRSILVHEG